MSKDTGFALWAVRPWTVSNPMALQRYQSSLNAFTCKHSEANIPVLIKDRPCWTSHLQLHHKACTKFIYSFLIQEKPRITRQPKGILMRLISAEEFNWSRWFRDSIKRWHPSLFYSRGHHCFSPSRTLRPPSAALAGTTSPCAALGWAVGAGLRSWDSPDQLGALSLQCALGQMCQI